MRPGSCVRLLGRVRVRSPAAECSSFGCAAAADSAEPRVLLSLAMPPGRVDACICTTSHDSHLWLSRPGCEEYGQPVLLTTIDSALAAHCAQARTNISVTECKLPLVVDPYRASNACGLVGIRWGEVGWLADEGSVKRFFSSLSSLSASSLISCFVSSIVKERSSQLLVVHKCMLVKLLPTKLV